LTYEKRIEVRWRDVDALRHVNNAVYATYLEECRDGWLEQALGADGAMWDYVLARVAIDFRREVGLDEEAVLARASLAKIGTRASPCARRSESSTGRSPPRPSP
jgi:acyl-CoA thioester hydrolase